MTDSTNPRSGEWGKEEDHRGRLIDTYTVKTAGGTYTATVGSPGGLGRNVEFRDSGGSMDVTGVGGAADTFTKVNTALVALIKSKGYDVLTFSAAEPSRQRLYSRLVSSLSRLVP